MELNLSYNDMRRINEIAKYQGYQGSKEGKLSHAEIKCIVSEAIIALYVQEEHKKIRELREEKL